jgi:hypothetical protein
VDLCRSAGSDSWEHALSGSAFDRHERAVSERIKFMLHDEPKGLDVDHALRLFVALEYHALPGRLTQHRRRPSYASPLWDKMYD